MTAKELLAEIGTGPAFPYAVSSVERNMFLFGWKARAIEAGVDWEKISDAVAARLAATPYTRWSGD